MIAGARRLPPQRISIRVPWHDSGWNGTVCTKPGSSTACRSLAPIADSKDDTAENEVVAFAPDEAFVSFSNTSEHVSHDHAIASVLACMRALHFARRFGSAPAPTGATCQ